MLSKVIDEYFLDVFFVCFFFFARIDRQVLRVWFAAFNDDIQMRVLSKYRIVQTDNDTPKFKVYRDVFNI